MIKLKDDSNSLYRIESAVRVSAASACYSLTGQPLGPAIESIVTQAVMAGIRELINQQYSDDDFEMDMKLKP